MTTGNTPRNDTDLEAFLARQSPLSTVYDAIEPVESPEVLDARILAMARSAASGAGGAASAKAPPVTKAPPVPKSPPVERPAAPGAAPPRQAAAATPAIRPTTVATDDDDADDDPPPTRRPRWLVPAALAATVLVAVGLGVTQLDTGTESTGSSADSATSGRLGVIFARRARERREAEQAAADAAAAAASEEAEVELAPLPPPPIFDAGGPQVEDVDTAIALIRKELVLAATAEEAKAGEPALAPGALAAPDAAPARALPATPDGAAAAGIVQSRNRRLAKILELYDGGNPDLAIDSLEIFLRDFADDPISKRIEDAQPRATDVAVE